MISKLRVSVDCENCRDKEPELVFQLNDSEFYLEITRTQYMILRNLIGIPQFGSGTCLEELNIKPTLIESVEFTTYVSRELSFKNEKGTIYNLGIGEDECILLNALFEIDIVGIDKI